MPVVVGIMHALPWCWHESSFFVTVGSSIYISDIYVTMHGKTYLNDIFVF